MAITTSILTAGTNAHQTTSEEANRFVTNFITPGVVGSFTANTGSGGTGAYAVNAAGTPNKTVLINTGDVVLAVTPSTQALQNLTARNDAVITQTISDNLSGSTMYDWVYAAANATNANNPNLLGTNVTSIVVNRSTSISTDTVGAPANSQPLAVITLINGFTSIPNSAITDKRVAASAAVLDGSITAQKLSTTAITLGYAQTTSNFSVSTTDTAITGLSVSPTIPSGSRRVEVEIFLPRLTPSGFPAFFTLTLWLSSVGGTQLQQIPVGVYNASIDGSAILKFSHTPSAGAATYIASIKINGGTGTVTSAATAPSSITVKAI